MRKFIASLLMLSLASPAVAVADDDSSTAMPQLSLNLDLRVTDLNQGVRAPFTGILMTPDSLAKIEYDNNLRVALLENQHSFAIQRLQLRLDSESQLRLSEKTMYEEIFSSQLKRIESLEEIAISKRPDWVMPVAILASFVVGAGVTVGITYAVNQ
tara:strand:+ start:330 stop:797 length:468 start_codon:yes stop_codon:yes gene_type:complete